LETYIQDAEREGDTELATIFRKAQAESRKAAEQGKELLRRRLGTDRSSGLATSTASPEG
jgi:rubrerythrin